MSERGPRASRAGPRRGRGKPAARSALSLRNHSGRLFGGVDFSGDMRDSRDATWLAVVELQDDHLEVIHLEATGRTGLEAHLKDSEPSLLRIEAIGMDFPFSLPLSFARRLLRSGSAEPGWWDLARRFESLTRPHYLQAIDEFVQANGEVKRRTDDLAGGFSPLHRVKPDLGPMTYHGIRMVGKERSRHALRPFEKAKGRLLFEVYPGGFVRKHRLDRVEGKSRTPRILAGLEALSSLPVAIGGIFRARCLSQRDALDAVLAARCAAGAVLSGETDRTPEQLDPDHAETVRFEGWIYGLAD